MHTLCSRQIDTIASPLAGSFLSILEVSNSLQFPACLYECRKLPLCLSPLDLCQPKNQPWPAWVLLRKSSSDISIACIDSECPNVSKQVEIFEEHFAGSPADHLYRRKQLHHPCHPISKRHPYRPLHKKGLQAPISCQFHSSSSAPNEFPRIP